MALTNEGYVNSTPHPGANNNYNNDNKTVKDMSSNISPTGNSNNTRNNKTTTASSPRAHPTVGADNGSVSLLSQGGYSAQNIVDALVPTRQRPP